MDIAVSLLVLTYNRFTTSSVCIPEVLSKIGDIPYEILIWDNCSTDGTYDWLLDYFRADCRITKVFGSNKNYGVEAINFLAKEARGKYILKVDDDVSVPKNFAKHMVEVYEKINDPKLLYLGWDIPWRGGSFAKRSGMRLYSGNSGKVVSVGKDERVLISYNPSSWMVNGICRLSPKKQFLEIGGHPAGVIYGADYLISLAAERNGYWIGFLDTTEFVYHMGNRDSLEYRSMKDKELRKHKVPRHV